MQQPRLRTNSIVSMDSTDDPTKTRTALSAKDMDLLTSKDWLADYTNSHVEIDIQKAHVFDNESDSDDDEEEQDTVPALLESSSNVAAESPAAKILPPVPSTDWDKEYNTLFGVVFANKDDDLVEEGQIPCSLPDAALAGTSLDLRTGNPALDLSIREAIERSIAQAQEQKTRRGTGRKKKELLVKEFVQDPTDLDVLLGRGGKSNHHPGNKKYRDEVGNLQQWYKASQKNEKTDLSQCLVNYVHSYGGRFLKADTSGKWYIVTNLVARRKASQALREHATPEERAARKAEQAAKKG